MLQIVINSLMSKLSENELKGLAYKVAKERNDTNINIGEFVYNVNLGRSIIIKYVNQSGIEIEKLQPIIDLINQQFDLFCYYAVSKYTELKDKKYKKRIYSSPDPIKTDWKFLGRCLQVLFMNSAIHLHLSWDLLAY